MSKIHVELLKRARKLIEDELEFYICLALSEAAQELEFNLGWSDACRCSYELKSFICTPMEQDMGALMPCLEEWLVHIGFDEALLTDENMVAYRLRYIDHLIEEWRDAP